MVEGIFDLGKAGFRKGLRLTGLQDNIENAKATLNVGQTKCNLKKKTPKTASTEKSMVAEECLDTVWMNPLTTDSPNFDGQILLVSTFGFPLCKIIQNGTLHMMIFVKSILSLDLI